MGKYQSWEKFRSLHGTGGKINYVCFACRRSVKQGVAEHW